MDPSPSGHPKRIDSTIGDNFAEILGFGYLLAGCTVGRFPFFDHGAEDLICCMMYGLYGGLEGTRPLVAGGVLGGAMVQGY